MLILNVVLAGGIAYVGFNVYGQSRPRKRLIWLTRQDNHVHHAAWPTGQEAAGKSFRPYRLPPPLAISSVSLGFSIAGTFGYPLLNLASIPLTLYSALPDLKQAGAAVFVTKRMSWSVVWSVVVVSVLATQRYLTASLLTWVSDVTALGAARLGRFNQCVLNKLFLELDQHGDLAQQILSQVGAGQPRSVWMRVNDAEVEVPFEDVRAGDVVVVNAGEIIPVKGTVCEGTAVVAPFFGVGARSSQAYPEKKPGDHVVSASRVISGQISIRVGEDF